MHFRSHLTMPKISCFNHIGSLKAIRSKADKEVANESVAREMLRALHRFSNCLGSSGF